VNRPVARYTPSRKYFSLALFALGGAVLAGWTGMRWQPAWIAAVLFALSALAVLVLALRPVIEIHETHLVVGKRAIAWNDIRRLDQTGWTAPLAVYLTLADQHRMLVVYPGDVDSATSLLRHLRRYSREALLDGIPYRQFWGEPPAPEPKQLPARRYPLLRPEDEEDVERMFQRLKSVGRLDQRGSDEK
jgi:Protein of unknown function (DUF3093)